MDELSVFSYQFSVFFRQASMRCATRSRALRERGLALTSFSEGLIGRRVNTFRSRREPQTHRGSRGGQRQTPESRRKASLTIRSSSEW